jgi:tetratricopeptide (TPR) repeat protein
VLIARQQRGQALHRVGRLEEAAAELEEVVAVLQDPERDSELLPLMSDLVMSELEVDTLVNLGFVLTDLGRLKEAQAVLERALTVAEEKGLSNWKIGTSAHCGHNAFSRGDWPAARRYIERALALNERLGTQFSMRNVYVLDSLLRLGLGDLQTAIQRGEEMLALAEQRSDLNWVRWAQWLLAEIDLEKGDPVAALARLSSLLGRGNLTKPERNLFPLTWIWAHLELGEVEAAETLATQMIAQLRTQHEYFALVEALRVEATIWTRQRRWDEAEAALQEGIALAGPMHYPYSEAKLLSTYGDLLVAAEQLEQARDRYEAALAILRPLGEVPYAQRIEQTLAEMRRR